MSRPPGPAASTIPSDTPKRILRGARIANTSADQTPTTFDPDHAPVASTREWVNQADSCPAEVVRVPGDQGQVIDQGDGGNLLVQGVFRVRDPQPAPDLGDLGVEAQDVVPVIPQDFVQPDLQDPRLGPVAPMPDQLDAPAQLADGDDGRVERSVRPRGLAEEAPHAKVGPGPLACLADDVRVNQIHGRP